MDLHIILAAGSGSRFGADIPKQFCLLDGAPVIFHTISAIRAAATEDDVIAVVINPEMMALWEDMARLCPGLSQARLLTVGGATRVESVANALAATGDIEAGVITIHDGARPLVDTATVRRVVDAAKAYGCAAVPVIPLSDSIRSLTGTGGESRPVDRSRLRAVQTPQAFPADLIRHSYRMADHSDTSLTDDASVYESVRPPLPSPILVDGSAQNIKITNPHDIFLARAIIDFRLNK